MAALPVLVAPAAAPVALGVVSLEPPEELLLGLESAVAAPNTPPWTVSGDDPCAFAAADL